MTYSAKVIEDSISPLGKRLTTLEVCIPRPILSEFNTHRRFSRNSASSRAIPVAKQLARIRNNPFMPLHWGKNQPGMQAEVELTEEEQTIAKLIWLEARDAAVNQAERLMDLGVHKQVTNRILEPYMWHTVIVTATEWSNFFALRRSPKAQPEIHHVADLMWDAMDESAPSFINWGEWHLPYIQEDERDLPLADLIRISSARCARVSYLTHDGVRDLDKDLQLYRDLEGPGHMSPMEHPATPTDPNDEHRSNPGNFIGWTQFRELLPHQEDFSKREAV